MKIPRLALTLLALSALALPAAAELVKNKDWEKSPEFVYLATDAEKKAWKEVKTDEAADKFVALFWARRDPDLKTPQNEYRARFEALSAKSDELFKLGSKRGALTERGKLFILVGPPKSMSSKGRTSLETSPGSLGPGAASPEGAQVQVSMVYEQAQLPEWADVKTLDAKFMVDLAINSESLLDMSTVRRLEKKAVEMAMKNPDLKEVPVYKTREQVEAEMKAAAEAAAEKEKGPELSAEARKTLEELLAKDPFGPLAPMGLTYRNGATRLMLQVHVAGAAVPSPEAAKLLLLVKTKDGKDAARREEPAALQKSKGELFADRSIPVMPGEYELAAAVLDAAGAVVSSGRRSVKVDPLPTELAASALLLAYNDMPAEGAKAEDPFIFSSRKFVVRGDGKFEKTDGLSYALRIYNPGIDPVTRQASLKRTIKIKPKNGTPQEVPLPPDEPTTIPDPKDGTTAVVIDLAGNIVDANLGDYFRPGDFEFRLKVTDTILNKTLEVAVPFAMAAPPAAAPAPAPAPKKK